jgi:polyhydroxyalkanoate synthesis regulator protein
MTVRAVARRADQPRSIRMYENKTLLDTTLHCFVTRAHLIRLIEGDVDFHVIWYQDGTDISRKTIFNSMYLRVLTHGGPPVLTNDFLREVIVLAAGPNRCVMRQVFDQMAKTLVFGRHRKVGREKTFKCASVAR